jgi:hypothetical protein
MHIGYYRILINKGERHESYNRSRMEMAGRTGSSPGRRSYSNPEGCRIRSRKSFHPGRSLGGQTKSQIQRRGAAATRRCSVSRFPSFRKNLIIPRAPAASWGPLTQCSKHQASSIKPPVYGEAPSCKRQAPEASSDKHQVPRSKVQASSRKLQAPRSGVPHKVSSNKDRGPGL